MALQLNYTEPSTGVPHPVSYWAIERATFNPQMSRTEFIIGGWHAQSQYAAGATPFARKMYRFNQVPAGSATFGSVVSNLYSYVQANPDDQGVMFFNGSSVVP